LFPVALTLGRTGGRHRSPTLATELARRLGLEGVAVQVRHNDIAREPIASPKLA
jgi:RNase adaptor protein for sRNA GlmZ degradation